MYGLRPHVSVWSCDKSGVWLLKARLRIVYGRLGFCLPLQQGPQVGCNHRMRVGGKFFTRGRSVQDAGKVCPACLRGFGIYGAVAHIQRIVCAAAQCADGIKQALRRRFGALDIFSAYHNVENACGKAASEQLHDAVAELGRDDSDSCSPCFQGGQHLDCFRKEESVCRHVRVGLLHIFFFVGGECFRLRDAGQNGKGVFERLADSPLDGLVGDAGVSVALQHIAESDDDASPRFGQGVVEVKKISVVVFHSVFFSYVLFKMPAKIVFSAGISGVGNGQKKVLPCQSNTFVAVGYFLPHSSGT